MNLSKIIFCFFISCITIAQKKSLSKNDLLVTYELEYQKHLGSDKLSVDQMILNIKENGTSIFLEKKMFVIDSIQKIRTLEASDVMSVASGNRYYIERKKNLITHTESFGGDIFQFEQNLKPNWTILEENKKINGFDCKKATLNYAGRDWIAWYAPGIARNAGPYKFYGLPGLILEVHDTNDVFSFTMISIDIANFIANTDILNYFIRDVNDVLKPISDSDFFKTRKKYGQMSADERLQYVNKTEPGAIALEATTLGGNKISTNRKPKEKNYIERFD